MRVRVSCERWRERGREREREREKRDVADTKEAERTNATKGGKVGAWGVSYMVCCSLFLLLRLSARQVHRHRSRRGQLPRRLKVSPSSRIQWCTSFELLSRLRLEMHTPKVHHFIVKEKAPACTM